MRIRFQSWGSMYHVTESWDWVEYKWESRLYWHIWQPCSWVWASLKPQTTAQVQRSKPCSSLKHHSAAEVEAGPGVVEVHQILGHVPLVVRITLRRVIQLASHLCKNSNLSLRLSSKFSFAMIRCFYVIKGSENTRQLSRENSNTSNQRLPKRIKRNLKGSVVRRTNDINMAMVIDIVSHCDQVTRKLEIVKFIRVRINIIKSHSGRI